MPIATPQGTLDFKSVDKVTFVGASSNTVIDTTTGSLGVGVGVGGPTSNLHVVGNTRLEGDINMLHTSNTASIKLNSNVVTEFPRSKKLIKYPRVVLTSAAQSSAGDYEGYIVNQSSVYTSESDHGAYLAFRGNSHWLSSSNSFDGAPDRFNDVNGPWISIQLPTKIKLEYLEFSAASGRLGQLITAGSVYASNNGSTWINIGSLDNLGTYTNFVPAHVDFTHTTLYDRYLLHVTANATNYVHMEKLSLFGIPEYDPEAHGTDVTVKSYPNVPNTDWLEVYYDGQDYIADTEFAGAGGVTDKAGGDQDGTVGTGVGFDTEYKAFTFDSSGSGNLSTSTITSSTLPSTFVDDAKHSVAIWFKIDTVTGVTNTLFTIKQNTTGFAHQTPHAVVENGTLRYDFWTNNIQVLDPILPNKWYHLVITFSGGNHQSGTKFYINGVHNTNVSTPSATDNLDIQENSVVYVGGSVSAASSGLDGSIANFRLFNRALTSDEIYQLYAYQKEDFGHGDLSMTLKAGRLGIGTSEPMAALDVRGDIIGRGIRFNNKYIKVSGSSTNSAPTATTAATVHYTPIVCTVPTQVICEVTFEWATTGSGSDTFKITLDENGAGELDINEPMYNPSRGYRFPRTLIGNVDNPGSTPLTFTLNHRRNAADDVNYIYNPRFLIYQLII